EYLLDKINQEQGEKGDIMNDLSDKLIEWNGKTLCIDCRGKIIINKLTNILNELTNKSDLTVTDTKLTNELLETSKMMENCTSCKDEIGKYYFEFYKSINEIEYLLDKINQEQGE